MIDRLQAPSSTYPLGTAAACCRWACLAAVARSQSARSKSRRMWAASARGSCFHRSRSVAASSPSGAIGCSYGEPLVADLLQRDRRSRDVCGQRSLHASVVHGAEAAKRYAYKAALIMEPPCRTMACEMVQIGRTLWLVKHSSVVVLFPERPTDGQRGPGSRHVLRSALYHLKPLIVVASRPPPAPAYCRVVASDLFATVQGYWVVPHTFRDGFLRQLPRGRQAEIDAETR